MFVELVGCVETRSFGPMTHLLLDAYLGHLVRKGASSLRSTRPTTK